MRPNASLKHEFVEFIPEELERGTLYISIRFKTGTHLCSCGCGNIVVTPLSPTDWKLTFDGKTVTLDPSIGNWSFPCRSHYWLRNNKVQWAGDWSQARIDANREYDRRAKDRYFSGEEAVDRTATREWSPATTIPSSPTSTKRPWWRSLWPW